MLFNVQVMAWTSFASTERLHGILWNSLPVGSEAKNMLSSKINLQRHFFFCSFYVNMDSKTTSSVAA